MSLQGKGAEVKRAKNQFELPAAGLGGVFNLAGEAAADPWRVDRERWDQDKREREARDYQAKMQTSLAQCPGFAGCDAPASEAGQGRVIVEPGTIVKAMAWLKRRFHVNENLDLSPDNGLCIEIIPKVKKTGKQASPVLFKKTEQFLFEYAKVTLQPNNR